MERTLAWIRDNPQFAALIFTLAVLTFVMAVLAVMMTKAGASLRPLVWFLGFFGIVAGPQAVVHLLDGFVLRDERQARAKDKPDVQPGPCGCLHSDAGRLGKSVWSQGGSGADHGCENRIVGNPR
jgi:hypothetical protein